MSQDDAPHTGNRLAAELSPYLQQHADNPVDWRPWGPEAFAAARAENKPVLLSIGYSTCHWCHVMERESFEREDVAGLINRHFVPIKVDREERPDVDELYMRATQLSTGRGGWPNTLWLLPDGRPFYAGTYFPPDNRMGLPGLKTVCSRLAELWRNNPAELLRRAEELAAGLQRLPGGTGASEAGEVGPALIDKLLRELRGTFDERLGGFGGAPKFPPHAALRLLLERYQTGGGPELGRMITRTLDAMSQGGIRDHVGGGFHRYSTDARWQVPHFEKMLYDNALLGRIYAEAFLIFGDPGYRAAAQDALDWALREMADPQGGFYSALDADVDGAEGGFYLWRSDEIAAELGPELGGLFCEAFNVTPTGNFRDAMTGGSTGLNVLFLEYRPDELARRLGLEPQRLIAELARARAALLAARGRRPRPHTDDKVIAGWNGLMISALAFAGPRLGQPRYTAAAVRAAEFVLGSLRPGGRLRRCFRQGRASQDAFLEDHAFLAEGLIALYEATGERRWITEARGLVDELFARFHDPLHGGFYVSPSDGEELLLRAKDPLDQSTPSGIGAAARVLLRLYRIEAEPRLLDAAGRALSAFAVLMERAPSATCTLISAAARYLEIVGRGQADAELQSRDRRHPVWAGARLSQVAARPGAKLEALIELQIDPGWHVNSARPLDPQLRPLAVRALDSARVRALPERADFPEAHVVELPPGAQPLSVYRGAVELRVPLVVAPDAAPGPAGLTLALDVQACNDHSCLAPMSLELPLHLEVVGPGD